MSELGESFSLEEQVARLAERLPFAAHHNLPLEQELFLLEQLPQFELGRLLLKERRLTGPVARYLTQTMPDEVDHPLERRLLSVCPLIAAQRERDRLTSAIVATRLKAGSSLLYEADECNLQIDWTAYKGLCLCDAGQKGESNFDFAIAHGFSIYLLSEAELLATMRAFCHALRPGGRLIISFLTPPRFLTPSSTWRHLKLEDILLQQALFSDILQISLGNLWTEERVRAQLLTAGLDAMQISFDRCGLMPTIVARRPNIRASDDGENRESFLSPQ